MKNRPHFKIVILEDNDFYNRLISQHIKNYVNNIALSRGFTFEVNSYTSFADCARNFSRDTNIVITDYYLNGGYNAMNLLELARNKGSNCKVIVLSQVQNIITSIYTILEGACEFVHKDRKALSRSGYLVEEIINENLKDNYGSPFLN